LQNYFLPPSVSIFKKICHEIFLRKNIISPSSTECDIAAFRYKQEAALYLEVLDAQRTVLQNEQLAVQIRGLQLVITVQLVKALGGGWQN